MERTDSGSERRKWVDREWHFGRGRRAMTVDLKRLTKDGVGESGNENSRELSDLTGKKRTRSGKRKHWKEKKMYVGGGATVESRKRKFIWFLVR